MRVSVNSVDTTVRVRVDNVTNRVTAKVFQGRKGDPGPAGPNSVTSSTTTNFTSGQVLFANGANVGSLSRSGIDTRTSFPNDDVTAASVNGSPDKLVRFNENGDIELIGNAATVSLARLSGSPSSVEITPSKITMSGGNGIEVTGANAVITTTGANGRIFTTGANAHIETTNLGAYIQTRSSFRYFDTSTGNVMTLAFASLTTNRTITFPNSSGTVALTSDIPTLGTGVATFLATPTSANLAAAVSDETGSGSLVFATSPTLATPIARGAGTTTGTAFTVQNSASTARLTVRDDGQVGLGGYVPSTHLPTSGYAGVWLDSSNSGLIGETQSGFKGAILTANATRSAGVWTQQDTARNSFILLLGYETNNNGLNLFRAPAGSGASLSVLWGINTNGQMHIGGNTPNAAAMLQVDSTTRGFLPPRMTTAQRDAISTPPEGLEIFNSTTKKKNFYNGTAWEVVTSS